MSSPSPQSRSGPNIVPIFAGATLAAGGYVAARAAGAALGYGTDVHPLRVVALCAPLFVGGVVALWPGRRFVTRFAVLLLAVGLGAAAWAFVPCRPGGPSLADAVKQRGDLKARLTPPRFEDVTAAGDLRQKSDAIAKDYPWLAAGLRADLVAWCDAATKEVAERFARTPPDDLPTARDATEKANRLSEAFPLALGDTNAAVHGWMQAAVRARSAELWAVAPGDWAGFDRTGPKRAELAIAFSAVRPLLVVGEDEWATRTARTAIDAAAKEPPRRQRETFRETEKQLLALASLNDAKSRFLAARQKLFAAAHEAARAEAREHIENRKFGLAFTVAVSHDLEWAATTQLLSADEQKSVAELRESCRYLAKLSEKAGDLPEVAPEPRSK